MSCLDVTLVPQLSDNYSYILVCQETKTAAIVDCPDAASMIATCEGMGVTPSLVLNTHHHWDHVGGNEDLKKRWPNLRIFGYEGDKERITGLTDFLNEGDEVSVGHAKATVMCTFGHTIGHISFYFAESQAVFCGDTMFAVGCGRLFEGTAHQMHASLQRLGALPAETKVYCGHEYTSSNIKFALTIEPQNQALLQRQQEVQEARANGIPTIPTTIGLERETNPFLRVDSPAVRDVASADGADLSDPATIFAAVRKRKDNA